MQVVLVYKSGKKFDSDNVKVLVKALRENGNYHGIIKCLTDCPESVEDCTEPIKLIHPELWGWWAKIERFRPGLFSGPILYFDLDTAILEDIHSLIKLVKTSPQPLFLESRKNPGKLASGINSWWGDQMSDIYHSFMKAPEKYIQEHKKMPMGARGPQGFVRRCINPPKLQDFLPDDFIIFRRDYIKKEWPDCRIVAWSGMPEIRNAGDKRIRAYWKKFSTL